MQPDGFDILYEEGPCLVVNKPGGLLTQAPPGIDSLEVRVKRFLKERDNKPGNVYLGVPHRLDRPASGAIVLARHVRAARRLAEQFESRIVGKTYWAVVENDVSPARGEWTDHLRKVPGEARSEVADRNAPDVRLAVLNYRVVRSSGDAAWLEIELVTGRTHQIRVQAASRSAPVLGDAQYGSQRPFGPQSEDARNRWIALHARSLSFLHPMTRQRVSVEAPLPEHWLGAGLIEEEDSQSQ